MAKKKPVPRDPFKGLSYGIDALIRNEGSTIEEVEFESIDTKDLFFQIGNPLQNIDFLTEVLKRFGQKFPVILRLRDGGKWQVVSGFPRVLSARKAGLKTILARLFDYLSMEDAIRLALLDSIQYSRVSQGDIENFEIRIREAGEMTGEVSELISWAKGSITRMKGEEEKGKKELERDIERGEEPSYYLGELIDYAFNHLTEASVGLEKIFENWSDVSPEERRIIAAECKYIHDLYPFLIMAEESDYTKRGE